MDKWTRSFLDFGFSASYKELMSIVYDFKILERWVKSHTDGMFGPLFGLSKVPEWLNLKPILANALSPEELNRYRSICAVSYLTQEIRIPVLYLLFRSWGFDEMKKYLDQQIKKGSQWSIYDEVWDESISNVNKIDLTVFSHLDEPSKLLLYAAASQGGRICSSDLPEQRLESFKFFKQPLLVDCVVYFLEDMRSNDLAIFLKGIGQKQAGTKSDRIKRILDTLSTIKIANHFGITEQTYLHFSDISIDISLFCKATSFLYDISWAVCQLNFMYVQNKSLIKEAQISGYGVRLDHHQKCPVHHKNSFKHYELGQIQPIAHPDCDAAILYIMK
jgi:hypothetical protein